MSKLIIVESFTKTKTIKKFISDDYTVICSLGHIFELQPKSLGIDIDTWVGNYEHINKKIINNIRTCVKNADIIYIASDPDIEGEAIANHIHIAIKNIPNKKIYRIKFNEISKNAILKSISNPLNIDYKVVEAQETRRFLDRLIGFSLSPLAWNKFLNNSLSVGRVQTVALFMSIIKFDKCKNVIADNLWNVNIKIKTDADSYSEILTLKLYEKELVKNFNNLPDIEKFLEGFDLNYIFDLKVDYKSSFHNPPPPYITTTILEDSYNKFKFNAKKTMKLLQELYENGHITYMRTDSVNISEDFKKKIISYISDTYGYTSAKMRSYKDKVKSQEAHEAIRITNVNNLIVEQLSEEHNKLYRIIWKRTIATQMIQSEYLNIDIKLNPSNPDYKFIGTKVLMIDKGYLIIYDCNDIDYELINSYRKMSKIKVCEYYSTENVGTQPKLYNDITLIKSMEKKGIGRPSTYSNIIEKLYEKKYITKGKLPLSKINITNIIKKKNISYKHKELLLGKQGDNSIIPTQLGIDLIEYLKDIAPYLLDIDFTSNIENTIDGIIQSNNSKTNILNDFYHNYIKPVIIEKNESNIIKTKYGYCYYNVSTKKYTNIESFLSWKNISIDKLEEKDINFIKSLPKKIATDKYLHIGRYGLYIKENGKNINLPKNLWDNFITNVI